MNIPAPLIGMGTTLGVAAVVGTAAGFGTRALLNSTEGKTQDNLATAAHLGGVVAMMAFWFTPGLPNKPVAPGLVMGAMVGLMIGASFKNDDAKAAAFAVQK